MNCLCGHSESCIYCSLEVDGSLLRKREKKASKMKISDKTLQEVIDVLRATGSPDGQSMNDDLANMLQFGVKNRDPGNGQSCHLCNKLVGGDPSHKCW